MLDTIAVRAPFGAKKGLTVKGKTTESEIVFTSWEKSIPSRNFAEILVFRRASVSSTYPYQSVRWLVSSNFLDLLNFMVPLKIKAVGDENVRSSDKKIGTGAYFWDPPGS